MPEHVGLAAGDRVTRWQAGTGPVRSSCFCAPEFHAAGVRALGAPHPQPLLGGSTVGPRWAQLRQIVALNSQIAACEAPDAVLGVWASKLGFYRQLTALGSP